MNHQRPVTLEGQSGVKRNIFTVKDPQTPMSASGIPVQSKLEPYFDLIVASRRRRKTWAQIAELIKDRGTSISRQRLVIFFKTRKKRHRALSNEAEIHEKSATTQNPTQVEWPNGESAIGSKLLARHVPQTHAKPYQSPLWKHLETIRTLRRKRETWAMIALHLEDAHGLKVSKSTVFKFSNEPSVVVFHLGSETLRRCATCKSLFRQPPSCGSRSSRSKSRIRTRFP
jgi:hypothetical protein